MLSRFLIVLTDREKETVTISAPHTVEHYEAHEDVGGRSQTICLRNFYFCRLKLFLVFLKIFLIFTTNILAYPLPFLRFFSEIQE
jgi:hypothetical protein